MVLHWSPCAGKWVHDYDDISNDCWHPHHAMDHVSSLVVTVQTEWFYNANVYNVVLAVELVEVIISEIGL